ncbi:MAG: hypothetical protein GX660_29195, partial [Clostridiaceae bacterium]|nr:hypothetical protein [Clostridiaceae bacterium]
INRRITRRMVINKAENIPAYIEYLRSTPNELQALFDDLLIGVTSFFREPQTFAALKEKALPEIVKNRLLNQPIRVWVPGCSTGEEVYSIAIAIQEFFEENDIADMRIQIFGTDANEKAIEKARQGIYPKNIEENVSENRLKRFFSKNNGNYQIIKPIRDMCIFAKHDITVDPPFSNLDIIVCRNVLIYFDASLHEKVLPTLYYGLKPDGFLVLGESESVGKFNYLFEQLSSKSAVFKKKRVQLQPTFRAEPFAPFAAKKAVKPAEKIDQQNLLKKEFDHLLLEQYIPAALLVNSNLDVLFFRGQVNPYLTHDPGTASLNVSKLICKELRSQVQSAIYRVRKDNKAYNEIVRLEQKEQQKAIEVHVEPLKVSEYDELFYTISFKEVNYPVYLSSQTTPANASAEIESIKDRQIVELKEDLESTKQSLETIIEAHEATNEELRSAMEESQSSNEELKSMNEELETAKEELQSSNEELQTLNEELKNRNQELFRVNDDLTNLITNIDTTVIIVDDDFKIRRFSAAAQEVLRIAPTDVGRLITDLLISIQIKDLEKILQNVTSNLVSVRREVTGGNDRFYELRVKPYLTSEKKIDGAILIFVD